ncbi:MAG TPA: LysE family transporter [Verrucomicrobiae bacterium]|jgi:threonine/homoserine/homoserine lactone efflux protein|nr:LysE family transporter [Verrucomicrobiae bacterium]
MFEQHPDILAAVTGLISGLLLSIPVGPVNLTIINEGARRGFLWALLIGAGAMIMELIYCTIAFTGFASVFEGRLIKAILELTSFVFLLYLGIRFLTASAVASKSVLGAKITGKLNPHSGFMVGVVQVLANPGVFVFWIVLAANFTSRDWVPSTWPGKISCIAGVAVGISAWFAGLAYAVSLGHKKFTDKTLLRMEQGSGICLLGLALIHGGYIVVELAKHKL